MAAELPPAPAAPGPVFPRTTADPDVATVGGRPARRRRLPGVLLGDAPWVLLVAALLLWTVLGAKTGGVLAVTTLPLLAVTVVSGLVCVASALWAPRHSRPWGAGTLLVGALVVALTGLSISWSVSPDASWFETNRTLTYVAAMAGGAAAARLAPGRWQAPLGGVLLGTTIVCLLGLGAKVFPEDLPPDQVFARLQAPIGYWNALGAIAAFSLVLSLWLGTRRDGYRPLNALSYPVAAIAVITLLLTYSRGSLAAAALGVLFWVVLAPRRLHSLLILVVGVLGGGFVAIWAFAKADLSTDKVVIAAREVAGAEFGVLLVAALLFLLTIGLVIEFATVFTGMLPVERRRLGVTVAVAVSLIPLAGVGVLATSEQGLTGSVSNAWTQLTDPSVSQPSGDPSRLTAVESQRSNYWRQGLDLYRAQPLHGVGAGGFGAVQSRVRENGAVARHAHGWIPQTLGDLGWTGMLAQLALAVAFLAAAARAVGLWGPLKTGARTAERDGAAAAIAVVAAFAVTSMADWTWFVPGVTLPMMLLAGWVVGRGAEAAFAGGGVGVRPRLTVASPRTAVALVAAVVTVVAAFSLLQPWRADRAADDARATVSDATVATGVKKAELLRTARAQAEQAVDLNPLSVQARYALAGVRIAQGDVPAARRVYTDAVAIEPAAPASWEFLASFEIGVADDPERALRAAGVALKMAPTLRTASEIAVRATRQLAQEKLAQDGVDPNAAAAAGQPGAAQPRATAGTGAATSGTPAPAAGTGTATTPAPAAGTTTAP